MAWPADNTNSVWNQQDPSQDPNWFGVGQQGNGPPPQTMDVGELGGGGGADFAGWLSQLGNGASNFLQGSGGRWGSLIPALATAYTQWQDAGKYGETAKEASKMASPFSKYRGYYGDRLQRLYEDPTEIENTPGYKFALQQGMDATARNNASKGYMGSGKMTTDLMEYGQGLASQTWNTEADRLSRLAGAQFNDADGARILMQGNDQEINARNGALAAMMYPFGMNSGSEQGNGRPGQGQGRVSPEQAIQRLAQGGASTVMGPASQWIQDQLRQGLRVDPNDPHVSEAIREMTGGDDPWNLYNPNGDQSWDEWTGSNNSDIMDQLGGGDYQGIPGYEEWGGGDWGGFDDMTDFGDYDYLFDWEG